MNNNHRTDFEFDSFLNTISGVTISHKPHLPPITERKYFGINNGWLGILQRLFETLIALGWDKSFINVKQKFGGMSVFIDNIPENGFHFVIESERESFSVCEICGEPGERVNKKNWYYTLCQTHSDLNDVIEINGEKFAPSMFGRIKNGDLYYDAFYHEIKTCDTDNFFNPWCIKVIKY